MSQSNAEIPAPPASGNTNDIKSRSFAVAGIAGLLASACCIGPLVLASMGLGTIAAGIVAMFEPLRPVFILIAFAALGIVGWKIYRRPVTACEPGAACVVPRTGRTYEALFWVTAVVVLALITFPYYIALFY